MNKDFQDVEQSIFDNLDLKLPKWLKFGMGGIILLILLSIAIIFLIKSSPTLPVVNKKPSPAPSAMPTKRVEKELSSLEQKYQAIKAELDNLNPAQKELLPPNIDLELEFENE